MKDAAFRALFPTLSFGSIGLVGCGMTWGFHNIPLIGFLFDEEASGVPSFIRSQKNSDKLERHYPAIKEAMNGVFTKKANGSNPPYNW